MPELPEVETIRVGLEKKLLNKKIIKIKADKIRMIRNDFALFKNELMGSYFLRIERIGKLLIFFINKNNKFLLVHLKMTGQLVYCSSDSFEIGGHANSLKEVKAANSGKFEDICIPGKFTHIIFEFNDGSRLFFNDMRQFGYMKIVDKEELKAIKRKFGIEPLQDGFNWDNFEKIFKNRKTNIKNILLNQQLISGIGNIYADEILFKSSIMPTRKADTLSEKELKKIFKNTEAVIKKAIKYKGTTFSDYIDSDGKKGNYSGLLKVYGRAGKKCLKCKKAEIKKIKLSGRGTSYCPVCQK